MACNSAPVKRQIIALIWGGAAVESSSGQDTPRRKDFTMAKERPITRYRNFYVEWLRRAFREAFLSVGFEGGADIMRGIVLWAVAVLALYMIDWSGWPIIGTIDAEPAHEVRFGLCAVVAIILVFCGFLVWHLIVQPVRIHKEAWEKIGEDERLIAAIGDSEVDRVFLSKAHAEGFQLYRAEVNCDDPSSIEHWKNNMDAWVEKIKSHLAERWSISAQHDFNDLGSIGGFTYRRGEGDKLEGIKDDHGFSILCKYSAYLKSVDQIIRFGAYRHLGDVQELLLKRDLFKRNGERASSTNGA